MKPAPQSQVELRDVAPGLWIWRLEHPHWRAGQGWESIVASTCVESGGETLLLDPLAPPESATEVWKRLDARPPIAVVVLKPDHVRDVDLFVRRYNTARSVRASSFARMSPRLTCSGLSPAASFRESSLLSTTDAVATRRRCGSPSNALSFSPTR